MKVTDARAIVEAAQVDPTYYSFDIERHDALCIVWTDQRWKVFVSERGVRHEERSFTSEDEACVWFLTRLFRLWQAR